MIKIVDKIQCVQMLQEVINMLKIEIEINGNVSNTSTIGKATVEESIFSYQSLLVVAENIKQTTASNREYKKNWHYKITLKLTNIYSYCKQCKV